ncbi:MULTISPECIES: hypothetical protein [Bacillus]|uniref:hypothetical protein n=1 Tax=Bacillus TaxID=1386 RepID=UPI000300D8F0|nr:MULTISPECIES: hypothetical protein [Bacillus]
MKKLLLTISLVSFLIIAGCGNGTTNNSDENQEQPKSNASEQPKDSESNKKSDEESKDNQNTEQKQESSTTEQTDQSTSTNDSDDSKSTYQQSGQAKPETAKTVQSDNQEFSIDLLPGYELTGEEPRKDVLYKKDAEELSMRIELLPTEDLNWSVLEENIPTELSSVSTDITNPTDANLQINNASIYEANNGTDIVTIYLVKSETKPMKLTVFSTVKDDNRAAFVEMARTIK